jgi:hypothetical protein
MRKLIIVLLPLLAFCGGGSSPPPNWATNFAGTYNRSITYTIGGTSGSRTTGTAQISTTGTSNRLHVGNFCPDHTGPSATCTSATTFTTDPFSSPPAQMNWCNSDRHIAIDLKGVVNGMPLERLGPPADVAAVVAFLAGPDGAWINGHVLRANGGIV